ncbi:MAG: OmpA family protein [Mangrovibacterium sp.]
MKQLYIAFLGFALCISHFALAQSTSHFSYDSLKLVPFRYNTLQSEMAGSFIGDTLFFSKVDEPQTRRERRKGAFYDMQCVSLDEKGQLIGEPKAVKEFSSEYHDASICFSPATDTYFITRSGFDEATVERKVFRKRTVQLKIEMYNPSSGVFTPFPHNSTEYSLIHPSVNDSGDVLYFASDMPGGFGGYDIYRSELIHGEWSTPQNLGASINSDASEVFPFISNANELIFTSNREGGKGGLDIYISQLSEGKDFSQAVLMNAPINTEHDDFAFALSANHRFGVLSSNRGNHGDDDLYQFRLTQKQEIEAPSLLEDYDVQLGNINYDYNSAELKPEAKCELDKLVKLLQENPEIIAYLSSHTDSRGSADYNLWLSQQRAVSCRNYLVAQGVEAGRIDSRGMGESQLLNDCGDGIDCTEEMHRINRRTELRMERGEWIENEKLKTVLQDADHCYFILGGSFRSEQNANDYYEEMKKAGYEVQKLGIIRGGYYAVAIEGFASFKEAKKRVAKLRQKKGFEDVWIYER